MIKSHGDPNAKIMIVADCGTQEDEASGYAISGFNGDFLKSCARDNGLNWDHFWKACLIKEKGNLQIPELNLPTLSRNKEGNDYKELLKNEISEIRPNIIVPIGELSLRFLTGLSGIRKYRGSILPIRLESFQNRCLPILGTNPYLNEDYKLRFITRLDFAKLQRHQTDIGPIEKEGILWIAKTNHQVREFFERHYRKASYVVFDIETFASIPTCISFCFDGIESCTVPLLDWSVPFHDRVLMAAEVAKLLASPLPKVNQNILTFDWGKLERYGFYVENVSGDTMINASLLYAEFPKNLGFLTSFYTELPYHKDEGKGEGAFDPGHTKREQFYLYCAKDSLATYQIYKEQEKEKKELGLDNVSKILVDIFPIYKRMMDQGIRIDEQQRWKLLHKYESLFEIQLFKLQRLVGKEVNPNSPKQVREIIYDQLGFTAIRGVKRTKAGPSTDEESLDILAWMGNPRSGDPRANEICKTIVNCRKIHKVIEILRDPLHPDKRMRCVFNLAGTETGRTTGSSTTDNFMVIKEGKVKVVDLGHSFQTIGKHGFLMDGEELGVDLRSMFVPDSGYCFVENDLSQAEARVDAVLAKDFDFLPVFDGPIGIHRLTGSWLYNKDPLSIKKGTREYHESKTARHAGERNMREDRLMMMIHQPIGRCIEILKTFHAKQPNIRGVFHHEIRKAVQDTRNLTAPNGRRRDFYGRFDDHQVNEAISYLPQAIVTDQLKGSLRKTFDAFPQAIPLAEAHDGFLAEVPIGSEHAFNGEFRRNIQTPINFQKCTLSRDFELTIPAESSIGYENWRDMEDDKG